MRRALLSLILAWCAWGALAHEVHPAYLDLRQIGPEAYDVLWKVPGDQGDALRLALAVEFPDGTINITAPHGSFVNHAFIERWSVKRGGGLSGATVRVEGLDATATDVLARVQRLDGNVQLARLGPTAPSFVIEEAPGKLGLAAVYVRLGIEHILTGYDHLLFLLALMLIVRDRRLLVITVTAFTVAHSITLALSTLGVVHVPGRPVEATIALSILLLAAEIFRIRRGRPSLTARLPWAIAFIFGLLHGFGFASALVETGLPQGAIALALFMFNVGLELAQVGFIVVVLGMLALMRRISLPAIVLRRALPVATYGIGAVSAFWLIDRVMAFWV
jgi:hydrogenase/urease accessory protein HupE